MQKNDVDPVKTVLLRSRLTVTAAERRRSSFAGLKCVTATTARAVSNVAAIKRDACAATTGVVLAVVVVMVMVVVV